MEWNGMKWNEINFFEKNDNNIRERKSQLGKENPGGERVGGKHIINGWMEVAGGRAGGKIEGWVGGSHAVVTFHYLLKNSCTCKEGKNGKKKKKKKRKNCHSLLFRPLLSTFLSCLNPPLSLSSTSSPPLYQQGEGGGGGGAQEEAACVGLWNTETAT